MEILLLGVVVLFPFLVAIFCSPLDSRFEFGIYMFFGACFFSLLLSFFS